MSEYAQQAAHGAELQDRDKAASTAHYRQACHAAAKTTDTYDQIRHALMRELRRELTESGTKSQATKVATVALWLRAGNTWPSGKGLTAAYNHARRATVRCPNCSHSFVP